MKNRFLILLIALTCVATLWAQDVITYTADSKLPETTVKENSGLHTNQFYLLSSTVKVLSHTFDTLTHVGTIEVLTHKLDIGENAFYRSELITISIPAGVNSVGRLSFGDCYRLTNVYFAEGSQLTSIGKSAFSHCSALTSFTMPNFVTEVGDYAFYNCTSLTTVQLSSSLEEIGDLTFRESGLTSIDIPASVKVIGTEAFMSCTNLKEVHVNWTTEAEMPTLGRDVFDGVTDAVLYVPTATKQLYQGVAWQMFTIVDSLDMVKKAAVDSLDAKVADVTDAHILSLAATFRSSINAAETLHLCEVVRELAYEAVDAAMDVLEEAHDALPTEGTSGPAVVVTKGEKSVTLINPDKVTYKKIE